MTEQGGLREASSPPTGARAGCLDDATVASLVEGLLDEGERAAAEAHIAACADCRRLVSELARGGTPPATGDPEVARAVSPGPEGGDGDDGAFEPGAQLGRYVVLARVGEGGLGVVYAAYDPELDRRVAIKLLRSAARVEGAGSQGDERLLREAKALARLSHGNVVAVHDVGVLGGRVFVAMDFVAGTTLREWLCLKPRTWHEIVAAFREAGRGLVAAHAAGLVHRDFKPDNVLVRLDGHVYVTDFGLARPQIAPAAVRAAGDAPVVTGTLTKTGELVGTPAYMAPEQLTGGAVDARTDQFAFAVSLFEALYGERPFGGATFAELASEVKGGKPRAIAPPSEIPAWLDRAVRRALSVAPGDRFPTMAEMLAALSPPPSPLRPIAWTAAALALAGGALALGIALRKPAAAPVCGGAEAKIAAVWGDPERAAAQKAFEAAGPAYAAATWRTSEAGLDRFANDWASAYRETCEATRVRGEQSEKLLDQRMLCLEQRKKELGALVDLYAHATDKVVEKAADAASMLGASLSYCTAAALAGAPPVPADPVVRAKLDAVQGNLAAVKELRDEGRFKPAIEKAKPLVEAAKAIGYRPVVAEAELRLSELELAMGNVDEGLPQGQRAAFDAEAARMDALAARAWAGLIVYTMGQKKYGDSDLYERLAAAAIERLGGDAELEGALATYSSRIALDEGKYAEALDDAERGVVLTEKARGAKSLPYANALNYRFLILQDMGRYEEAGADAARVAALYAELAGPEHPRTAMALGNRGMSLYLLGDYAGAVAANRQALAVVEKSLGPDSPTTARTLLRIGMALVRDGKPAEARPLEERALAILVKKLSPSDMQVGMADYYLSELELASGNLAAAEKVAREAITIDESGSPTDATDAADPMDVVARVDLARGKGPAALALATREVAIVEKEHGPDFPPLGEPLTTQAEALFASGKRGDAQKAIARAIALFEAHPGDPHKLARARAVAARIDAKSGR